MLANKHDRSLLDRGFGEGPKKGHEIEMVLLPLATAICLHETPGNKLRKVNKGKALRRVSGK